MSANLKRIMKDCISAANRKSPTLLLTKLRQLFFEMRRKRLIHVCRSLREGKLLPRDNFEQHDVSARQFIDQVCRGLRKHGVVVRIAVLGVPFPKEFLVHIVWLLSRNPGKWTCELMWHHDVLLNTYLTSVHSSFIGVCDPISARVRRLDLIDQANIPLYIFSELVLCVD